MNAVYPIQRNAACADLELAQLELATRKLDKTAETEVLLDNNICVLLAKKFHGGPWLAYH